MSDCIVVNVISPQTTSINVTNTGENVYIHPSEYSQNIINHFESGATNINVTDTGENVYINPLMLNPAAVRHAPSHQKGGIDELSHNSLGELQGGSEGNYYHLTSGEYANLTTGDVVRPSETGNFITTSQTGAFYASNNPSGFITGIPNIVYTTGNQDINGTKDFQTRPTVTDIPVLISGDAVDTVHLYGKNDESFTLNRGFPVFINSANGVNPLISLASNTGERTSSKTIGLMAESVAPNNFGYIITEGYLEGFDTSAGNAGDPMWLGPTGNIIYGLANKPFGNNHLVYLGIVLRSNQNNGRVYVKIQNGFEIDELHSVYARNAQNKDALLYNSDSGAWISRQITTGDVSDINNFYLASNPSGFAVPVNPVRTTLTGNGTTSSYAISGATNLINPSALIVAIDGALQEPVVDYGVNNGIITFTDPLASGAKAVVISPSNALVAGQVVPSDGSVTSAKIAAGVELANPSVIGSINLSGQNIVGPVNLTSQDITSPNRVMNRSLTELRHSNRNKRITDDVTFRQDEWEQFLDFDDQYNADLVIADAFGSGSFSISPAVFGDGWFAPNAGVTAFQGKDFFTHRGILLIRGSSASNRAFYVGINRTTTPYWNSLSQWTIEFTCRVFFNPTDFATQGYFKIGPIPKGGTGGGDASLLGGLMFNPYLHPTNLVLGVTKNGVVSPHTFTTNPANVDFLDTGFNIVNYLGCWINITYTVSLTATNQTVVNVSVTRENIVLFSASYNLTTHPIVSTWFRSFALISSGASREIGFQYGKFTYTTRSEVYFDYLYYKTTGISTAPANWNSLRF